MEDPSPAVPASAPAPIPEPVQPQPIMSPSVVPSNQPRFRTLFIVLLAAILVSGFAFGGYYLATQVTLPFEKANQEQEAESASLAENEPSPEPASSAKPHPTLASTSAPAAGDKVFSGEGFQVTLLDGWNELSNDCQEIEVIKSDAASLSLAIGEFVRQDMEIETTAVYDSLVAAAAKDSNLAVSFSNFAKPDIAILGPQGEGELNHVYLRGPAGTGYYHIIVYYVGPNPDTKKACLGDKANEYKTVLSTFKVVS